MTDHSLGQPACLLLEDGSVHRGESFGAAVSTWGEVVFNTSMTGYQEVLTDPSYAGQLVTLTYPLVGNYGINSEDIESRRIQVSGLVVREHCDLPSHGSSNKTLHQYLVEYNIPGISGVDTRAITRRLRTRGVMTGLITTEPLERARERLAEAPRYDDLDLVKTVTTDDAYELVADGGVETPKRVPIKAIEVSPPAMAFGIGSGSSVQMSRPATVFWSPIAASSTTSSASCASGGARSSPSPPPPPPMRCWHCTHPAS